MTKTRYRAILACDGIPTQAGAEAATDIAEEFKQRPWHQNVTCTWDGHSLILQAENDYDSNGLALMDEFSDAICACIRNESDKCIRIISVTKL